MAHLDAHWLGRRGGRHAAVTAPVSGLSTPSSIAWCSPLVGHHFDSAIEVRGEEARAIGELGVRNLRRLQYHDPQAPGWRVIGRLLRPLETVNAGLDSPATAHRRRAMADAVAVLLVRCAEIGRTFWGWSTEEWVHLLGGDRAEFRRNAPAWAGDEVRPYLAAHAYLLGSFTEFHLLGSFQRLTLSRRIFGQIESTARSQLIPPDSLPTIAPNVLITPVLTSPESVPDGPGERGSRTNHRLH